MSLFRLLRGAISDFRHHGCPSLAASLAFFSLLSFFPLIFVLLYGFSTILRHPVGHEMILNFLAGFLPALGPDLAEEIKRVADIEAVRWVMVVTAIWFGMQVFYEMDYAVNVVFGTQRTRHPLLSAAMSAALVGLVGILLVLSYLVTQILGLLVFYAPRTAKLDIAAVVAHRFLLAYLLPFGIVLMAVTGLYRYLPQRRPSWRHAFIGGLTLAILWEMAKHLFSNYVTTLAVYSRLYGSLLFVILFLLWIYYSAMLFLFGAELVHRLQHGRMRRSESNNPTRPS
jgi:membrane protein